MDEEPGQAVRRKKLTSSSWCAAELVPATAGLGHGLGRQHRGQPMASALFPCAWAG